MIRWYSNDSDKIVQDAEAAIASAQMSGDPGALRDARNQYTAAINTMLCSQCGEPTCDCPD